MTVDLSSGEMAARIEKRFPQIKMEIQADAICVEASILTELLAYLKNTDELKMDYLTAITAVDYWDYFEVVYILTSLSLNQRLSVKTRCYGREKLSLPSVVAIYQSASYQEREIFELMGINFKGHPDLKPLFLWEDFQGYPLRKDYL
jgi:NADH-quinone oxidoreductase subunit C